MNRPQLIDLTLPQVLQRSALLHGPRVALVDGDSRATYAQAIDRARRLAAVLARRGARPGDRIAILDRNSARYLEAYFACAWAGFVIVPLNTRLAKAELDAIVAEAEPKTWVDDDVEREMADAQPLEPVLVPPDAPCAIYYTSGTTGEPKGVVLSQRAVVAGIADALYALALQPDDVWLHAAPLFHLAGACAVWAVTLAGARHVLMHFEPAGFVDLVDRERVTKTSLPPTLINMVVNDAAGDFSSLRRISYGGSPMAPAVYARATEVLRCELLQTYGITETAGFVCCRLPGDGAPPASVGWPVPNARVRVEGGEVWVAGPKLMNGYWRKPQASAEALRDGWYRTGDIGFLDANGALTLTDRRKDMIITGGENVYSVEVESALGAHPAVFESAVFGVPDERWGEAVRAVVVLRPGCSASEAELIDWCRARIGGYKVPKSIVLAREALPKSGPGKIAKHLVRKTHSS